MPAYPMLSTTSSRCCRPYRWLEVEQVDSLRALAYECVYSPYTPRDVLLVGHTHQRSTQPNSRNRLQPHFQRMIRNRTRGSGLGFSPRIVGASVVELLNFPKSIVASKMPRMVP